MLEFLTLNPKTFGLDISDLSLKVVELEKKRKGFGLSRWGKKEIEPGIIQKGEIKDKKRFSEEIKKTLKNLQGGKLSTKYVVVSLPEEKSFLQVIQMPKMSQKELKKSVFYEAENYIPLPIEDVYLDCQVIKPVQNNLDHFDVLINALPKKTIDPYIFSLKKAGLTPKVLEVESQAVVRALVKDQKSTSPQLIIDIGQSRTTFIVFSGYSLRFTFSVFLSSKDITKSISKGMNISFSEAEQIKKKYNLNERDKNKESEQIFKFMNPILKGLVKQTQKYISFYKTHISHEHLGSGKGGEIKKVVLCGGGANLKGLDNFLSQKINVPVKIGNPWINIFPDSSKGNPKLGPEESLSYTTALGLALRNTK